MVSDLTLCLFSGRSKASEHTYDFGAGKASSGKKHQKGGTSHKLETSRPYQRMLPGYERFLFETIEWRKRKRGGLRESSEILSMEGHVRRENGEGRLWLGRPQRNPWFSPFTAPGVFAQQHCMASQKFCALH